MNQLNEIRMDRPEEALESGLWGLSGVERRLSQPQPAQQADEGSKVRLGLQGRITVALLGIVLIIMIGVAVLELQRNMQIILGSGKTLDLRNLTTFREYTSAILFMLRTPVMMRSTIPIRATVSRP